MIALFNMKFFGSLPWIYNFWSWLTHNFLNSNSSLTVLGGYHAWNTFKCSSLGRRWPRHPCRMKYTTFELFKFLVSRGNRVSFWHCWLVMSKRLKFVNSISSCVLIIGQYLTATSFCIIYMRNSNISQHAASIEEFLKYKQSQTSLGSTIKSSRLQR